jgi:signal transduction histidine kinase
MDLLDDLLEFSRLDAGALRADMRPVKIQSLFRSLLDDFTAEAQERGLRLVVKDTDLVGRTDPRLIKRILRNLVSNSFKFTQRGSVLIAARPRGDTIRLEVWDTGRGIPTGQQRQIFGNSRKRAVPSATSRCAVLALALPLSSDWPG